MGDRTTVYIHIRKEHKEKAMSLLEVPEQCVWGDQYTHLVSLEFCEVNYADVESEVEILSNHGIPLTWDWGSGGSYEAGFGYAIFDEDCNAIQHSWDITERGIDCDSLLKLLDEDITIEEVRQAVESHKTKHTLPELDEEQIRRGKVYVLRRIVAE